MNSKLQTQFNFKLRGLAINFTLTYPADHIVGTEMSHFCHTMTISIYRRCGKTSYYIIGDMCHIMGKKCNNIQRKAV